VQSSYKLVLSGVKSSVEASFARLDLDDIARPDLVCVVDDILVVLERVETLNCTTAETPETSETSETRCSSTETSSCAERLTVELSVHPIDDLL